VKRMRHQRCARSKPSRRRGCFRTCMAAADDDDVESQAVIRSVFHVKHHLLSDTELPKDPVQDLLYVHLARDLPE
jgi:hypothetical protein